MLAQYAVTVGNILITSTKFLFMISTKHPNAYLTLLIATFIIISRFCYGGTPCSPHLTDGKPLNVTPTRTEKLYALLTARPGTTLGK